MTGQALRRLLAILCGLSLPFAVVPAALAVCSSVTTTTSWSGDTGAESWSAPKWSSGVPQTCSAVTIAPDVSASPLTLTGIPSGLELASLSVGPGVELMDGSLQVGELAWHVDATTGYANKLAGEIVVSGPAALDGSGQSFISGRLQADGPATIESGDFYIELSSGGDLGFEGGLDITGVVDVEGAAAGTAVFGGGGLSVGGVNGSLSFHAMTSLQVDTTVTLGSGADLVVTDSALAFRSGAALAGPGTLSAGGNSGTMAFAAPLPLSDGAALRFEGGQLNGPASLTGTGTFAWHGGTVNGSLTLGTGLTSSTGGMAQKFLGTTAAITNHGTFALTASTALLFTGGSPSFTNTGTLAGGGTIEADVGSTGIVDPLGTLTVDGDYGQSADGELRADVGSGGADRLAVSGAASFAGTLRVVSEEGFTPGESDTFQIASHGSRSGTFDTVRGRIIDEDHHYEVIYSATGTSLAVEPGGGPALSVADAQAAEGAPLVFDVTLSQESDAPVTVQYATSDGSAGSGDYASTSGQLEIAAGQTKATIQVPTTADAADEPDETLTLTLSQPDEASLADASATGTIADDDEPPGGGGGGDGGGGGGGGGDPPPADPPRDDRPGVPFEPGPLPLPQPVEVCTGSTTLTIAPFALTACFTKNGNRYTASGDLEVNGLLLRARSGTGKIIVDLDARTIEGSLPGTLIDVYTPLSAGVQPLLFGTLEALDGLTNKVGVFLRMGQVGQLAARILTNGPLFKGVRLLAGRTIEVAAMAGERLELAADAAVGVFNNALGRLRMTTQRVAAAGRRLFATLTAPGGVAGLFDLRDINLEYDGTEFTGSARLRIGMSETNISLALGEGGLRRAHAESATELQVTTGLFLDSYSLDLAQVGAKWILIGRVALSARVGGTRVVSGSNLAIDYTRAPDGLSTLTAAGTGATVAGETVSDVTITATPRTFDFVGGLRLANAYGTFSGAANGWVELVNVAAGPIGLLGGGATGGRFMVEAGGTLTFAPLVGIAPISSNALVTPAGWASCASWTTNVLGKPVTLSVGISQRLPGSAALFVSSCDLSAYRIPRPAARAAQAGTSVTLPERLPLAAFAVRGTAGPPQVTVTGPNGQALPAANGRLEAGKVLAAPDPGANTTHLLVGGPAAGRYTFAAAEGSPPIADVQVAEGLRDPSVRAKVSGKGRRRVLSWTATPNPGQRIAFYEEGGGTRGALGRPVTGARGRIRFSPADGKAGRRTVVAVVEQDGLVRETVDAGTYSAPAARPVPAPRRIRARHRRTRLVLAWRGGRGIDSYRVTVRPRGSAPFLVVADRARVTLSAVPARQAGSVSVQAVGRDGRLSRLGRGRFRAAR